MAIRWRVLALLFLVRTTMAFQFQAVGTLSPAIQEAFAVGIADIGVLIGLYFTPGLFLAAPGGALGRRFGDKRVVLTGLALMVAGGVLMAVSDLWAGQIAPVPVASDGPAASGDRVRGALLGAVLIAGAIWGLYNTALAVVFSFGPELFVSRGMGLAQAGSVTSIVLWLLAIVGSFAGLLIDWTGRRSLILVVGNLGFALFVFAGSWTEQVLLNVIAMGAFSGVAVGAMMSLPAMILSPGARAVGMGIFFTVFYLCTMVGPMIAGWLAELSGEIAATYRFAALLLVATVVILPVYHALAARAGRSRESEAAD